MRPRKLLKLDEDVQTKLAMALITRFSLFKGPKIASFVAKKYIPTAAVLQWGRVQIAEGEARITRTQLHICSGMCHPYDHISFHHLIK